MKAKSSLTLLLLLIIGYNSVFAQGTIQGIVYEKAEAHPPFIPGANVYWMRTMEGVTTDASGRFSIAYTSLPDTLVISFIGFKSDTLVVSTDKQFSVFLEKSLELKTVDITGKQDALVVSTMKPMNVEKITQKELLKAACCNLSEAFETNPTISVAYKDAVTGAKEIQMLGLSGIYSALLTENIPNMRGLAGIYGLTFVPGPWMESIQLSKGAGSVLNGYESTTGLINVEFKKPNETETPRFFLNLFAEDNLATELNAIHKTNAGEDFSNLLMVHGRYMNKMSDLNNDNFADVPSDKQVNIYDRFQLHLSEHVETQFGIKYLLDEISGGELNLPTGIRPMYNYMYETKVNTKRFEAYGKIGIVYPEHPSKSIGNIFQFVDHRMNSSFGNTIYNAKERSFFYQGIYQDIIISPAHLYKVGVVLNWNELWQYSGKVAFGETARKLIPGIFAEYTYSYLEKFTLITGLREDALLNQNDNTATWLFTPRIHGKYNFSENFVFRFSAGRSYREPVPLADHISLLATSRWLDITTVPEEEEAWNYGINLTKKFGSEEHPASITLDLYRTDFVKQLVVDLYSDSNIIHIYSLDGKSYSNSAQVSFNVEVVHGLDLRLAYKTDDVKSTYKGILKQQPLVSKQRALANLAWESKHTHWKADYTLVWEGAKRLQPLSVSTPEYSPDFFVMNFQLTKTFRRFEIYGGAENILDFRQRDPILSADNPFGDTFDATNVWGPLQGRRMYIGLRVTLK
ncbi:MAG: TonB-dependent receptor [Bacteroidetes bacterium]|nr:TonB-dependent receptor [Bacteroidota bacterium]